MLPKPNDGFEWVQAAAGPALTCRSLAPFAANVITTRTWPLGRADADQREAAWADAARAIGVDPERLVRARQVHGAASVVFRRGAAKPVGPLPEADILLTDDPSLALAIQTADCVPLLVADRRTGVVAAAHAGWRGLSARVPGATVRALTHAFGTRPSDLIAVVGPSISADRYEVDAVVRGAFEAAGFSEADVGRWFGGGRRPGHWQFDGWTAARDQLAAAGVPPDAIHVAGLCTGSHPEVLCSYRRDGAAAGRIAAVVRAR